MEKLLRIPVYVPFIGLIIAFALIFATVIFGAATEILIAGFILLHLAGWIIGARFFLIGVGSFGSVLSSK